MLRLVYILTTLTIYNSVYGQDIMFDDIDADDGAIHVQIVNGEEVTLNAQGEIIELHDIYRQSEDYILSNGFGTSIKRAEDPYRSEGATFNLIYLDIVNNTGIGFDDPQLGDQRRAALEAAFEYYASVIEDQGTADIEIRESFSGNPASNPFAFAAAYYYGSKGFNESFTQVHLTTGTDPHGPYPDGYMQFNFHPNLKYNYNVNGNPGQDQYDFYTIVLHEALHLLGFTSYATENGQSAASEDVYTSFDEFLSDYKKDPIFELTGSGSSTAVSNPSDGVLTNNQVWFELYPNHHAPVFSPNPFNGSSLDHFDNARTEHGAYLMHPSLTNGQAFKLLHQDEVRVLEQLGYQVNYSIATSIEELESEDLPISEFSDLYPNPAYSSDAIQIDFGNAYYEEVLVIVYDMMGRESYSKVLINPGPGPVTAVDPYNNLTPGMYIVVGSSHDELFNQKLVIN